MRTAAIILAAGKGTRMRSDLPKVVFEIDGVPMINRVINTAKEMESERIIVVIGYKKEVVKAVIPEMNASNLQFRILKMARVMRSWFAEIKFKILRV